MFDKAGMTVKNPFFDGILSEIQEVSPGYKLSKDVMHDDVSFYGYLGALMSMITGIDKEDTGGLKFTVDEIDVTYTDSQQTSFRSWSEYSLSAMTSVSGKIDGYRAMLLSQNKFARNEAFRKLREYELAKKRLEAMEILNQGTYENIQAVRKRDFTIAILASMGSSGKDPLEMDDYVDMTGFFIEWEKEQEILVVFELQARATLKRTKRSGVLSNEEYEILLESLETPSMTDEYLFLVSFLFKSVITLCSTKRVIRCVIWEKLNKSNGLFRLNYLISNRRVMIEPFRFNPDEIEVQPPSPRSIAREFSETEVDDRQNLIAPLSDGEEDDFIPKSERERFEKEQEEMKAQMNKWKSPGEFSDSEENYSSTESSSDEESENDEPKYSKGVSTKITLNEELGSVRNLLRGWAEEESEEGEDESSEVEHRALESEQQRQESNEESADIKGALGDVRSMLLSFAEEEDDDEEPG